MKHHWLLLTFDKYYFHLFSVAFIAILRLLFYVNNIIIIDVIFIFVNFIFVSVNSICSLFFCFISCYLKHFLIYKHYSASCWYFELPKSYWQLSDTSSNIWCLYVHINVCMCVYGEEERKSEWWSHFLIMDNAMKQMLLLKSVASQNTLFTMNSNILTPSQCKFFL